MYIDWSCSTRKNLANEKNLLAVSAIFRNLSDWLGCQLAIDDETIRNGVFDTQDPNSLLSWVSLELERTGRNKDGIRKMIDAGVPFPRMFGSLPLVTFDKSTHIGLSFDEYDLAPRHSELDFGNGIWITSRMKGRKGSTVGDHCLHVLQKLVDNDLFDHAFCCLQNQYFEMNIDCTNGGMRAMGRDASKWLPGFYWANYFGPFLCERIGYEKLGKVPGCLSIESKSGVIVVNELPPNRWSEPQFIENAHAAMNFLGRDLFFEKGKTARGSLFTKA